MRFGMANKQKKAKTHTANKDLKTFGMAGTLEPYDTTSTRVHDSRSRKLLGRSATKHATLFARVEPGKEEVKEG